MTDTADRNEQLRLQRLLLPAGLPSIGCTEAAAAYRARNERFHLGGDWFDLIDRPQSQSVVAIVGDVVGHGVEQISVMGQLRAASNALAHSLDEPDEIVEGLDRFASSIPGARFATLAVLVLDGTPDVRICAAGHPPPIHVDRARDINLVETGRRAPLTVGDGSTGTFTVQVGELVVIYTDGVVERRGGDIDDGIARLGEFVRERFDEPCREIAREIVDVFSQDSDDDQAVLVIRPLHKREESYQLQYETESTVSWGDD